MARVHAEYEGNLCHAYQTLHRVGPSPPTAENDGFVAAILTEFGQLYLNGDIETAKGMLATYIKATCGCEDLARRLDKPSWSIKRMLSEKGNPTATNLADLLCSLSAGAGVKYHVEMHSP